MAARQQQVRSLFDEAVLERYGVGKYDAEIGERIAATLSDYVADGRGYVDAEPIARIVIGEAALAAMPETVARELVVYTADSMSLPRIARYLRKAYASFSMATLYTPRYVAEFRARGVFPKRQEIAGAGPEKPCLLAGGRGLPASGIVVDDPVMFDEWNGRFSRTARGIGDSAAADLEGARSIVDLRSVDDFPVAKNELQDASRSLKAGVARVNGRPRKLIGAGKKLVKR